MQIQLEQEHRQAFRPIHESMATELARDHQNTPIACQFFTLVENLITQCYIVEV